MSLALASAAYDKQKEDTYMLDSQYGHSPLALLMAERGLTQSSLSREAGGAQATISRFLRCKTGISIPSLMKLSNFFLVDVGTLCAATPGVDAALIISSSRPDLLKVYTDREAVRK